MKPLFLISSDALARFTADQYSITSLDRLAGVPTSILRDVHQGFSNYNDYRITSIGAALALSLRDEIIAPTIKIEQGVILNPGYWSKNSCPNIVTGHFIALTAKKQMAVMDMFMDQTLKKQLWGYLPHDTYHYTNILGSHTIQKGF